MKEKILFVFLFFSLCTSGFAQKIYKPPFRYAGTDSVITIASDRYKAQSFLRYIFMGKNYRKVWSQEVKLPVFRLSQSRFEIEELGGGMQTKSLHLLDEKGKEWGLRSVEKYVQGALPEFLHNTVAEKITQDLISASLPYGAPVAGSIAKALSITAAEPKIVFVADDPALGPYRQIFANTVCSLEERDPSFKDTDNAVELVENLAKSNSYKVQQKVLLRARIVDMLLSDWDRHADNWRWGLKDSAGFRYYIAIPRDRDWVFYKSKGLVPKLARWIAMPHLVNFQEEAENLERLNYKEWVFDRTLLNELVEEDWQREVENIQQNLTREDIARAVKKMPFAVQQLIGAKLEKTLVSRLESLDEGVMEYFRFLNEEVWVTGSDQAEYFLFSSRPDGVSIKVFDNSNGAGVKGRLLFERMVNYPDTYSLYVRGLGGNDIFEVDEAISSKIKMRLHGGAGKDVYNLKGKLKTIVYDKQEEQNDFLNTRYVKIRQVQEHVTLEEP